MRMMNRLNKLEKIKNNGVTPFEIKFLESFNLSDSHSIDEFFRALAIYLKCYSLKKLLHDSMKPDSPVKQGGNT